MAGYGRPGGGGKSPAAKAAGKKAIERQRALVKDRMDRERSLGTTPAGGWSLTDQQVQMARTGTGTQGRRGNLTDGGRSVPGAAKAPGTYRALPGGKRVEAAKTDPKVAAGAKARVAKVMLPSMTDPRVPLPTAKRINQARTQTGNRAGTRARMQK